MGFPGGSDGEESACNKSPGKGNGNSLQYSCLENSMDRSAWQATVHGGHIESDMTVEPYLRMMEAGCQENQLCD